MNKKILRNAILKTLGLSATWIVGVWFLTLLPFWLAVSILWGALVVGVTGLFYQVERKSVESRPNRGDNG